MSYERYMVDNPPESRARDIKEGKYELREFKEFTLAAPPDLLHLKAAKVHAALMREIAKCASGGERVLKVDDLPDDQQKALRDEVRSLVLPWETSLADAPELRLGIGAITTFDLRLNGKRLPFEAKPTPPLPAQDKARMDLPKDPPKTNRGGGNGLPPRPGTGRLTFVLPSGVDGTIAMGWVAEAQGALVKEMQEARRDWGAAQADLLSALKSDVDGIYAHKPSDRPRIDDLEPSYRFTQATGFEQRYRKDLGGLRGNDWIGRAENLGSRTLPTLEFRVADKDYPKSTSVTYLPFDCPLGP